MNPGSRSGARTPGKLMPRSRATVDNNFGLLRLVLALLVAFTHSFEFIDGNAAREPFLRLFHTFMISDIAVDGFFLISGYLVTQSYLQSRSSSEYLGKRVLRIYPAYVVACGVSLLIGAIGGGKFPGISLKVVLVAMISLLFFGGVRLGNAFDRVPMHGLNGSMWTIAYEFRCYLAVLIFGGLGVFRR